MIIKSVKDIGKIVKETRKYQGLTQAKLAKLCNVGVRFVSELESGKATCQIDKILKVLQGLGVKINMMSPVDEFKGCGTATAFGYRDGTGDGFTINGN